MRKRKMNKKKIALIFGLSIAFYSQAEDVATESNASATTSPEASTPAATATEERSMPTSQINRIRGLINQLSQNQSHEIRTLNANGEDFLALFRDATRDPQGCIILLHGDTEHPDWPSVINPVRTTLNSNSWCSLSIEIPDVYPKESLTLAVAPEETEPTASTENQVFSLPNEETIFARIDTAIEFLTEQDFTTFAILGHRTGASYAIKYSADKELTDGALLLIAPIAPEEVSSFELSNIISATQLPILDYYFDTSVKESRFAQARQSAANKREEGLVYQQIKAFQDQRYQAAGEKRLTQRVWGFLKQNTPQKDQRRPLPSIQKGLFHQPKF
ncbi:DUF3530 family protein [Marinomonas agarivorans]|nr:DUF3530 family protein [Marinomonas agarivorans]